MPLPSDRRGQLNLTQRRFLELVATGDRPQQAYQLLFPRATPKSAAAGACRLMKEIQAKTQFRDRLEAVGLGEGRLYREMEARLTATTARYWQDKAIGETPDNAVRMEATRLLARMLGADAERTEADVTVRGAVILVPAKLEVTEWQEQVRELSRKLPPKPDQER